MKVVKKINNNVAICFDNNNQKLIALGKGIGFHKTPYELNDLSKIDMTFYHVSYQTIEMLSGISPESIMISSKLVKIARKILCYQFNQNMVFSLADHISFAIKREQENKVFDFSLSYDIEHLYPKEYSLGLDAIKLIKNEVNIDMPVNEAVAIAMHFINAKEQISKAENESSTDNLLLIIVGIIQNKFNIKIDTKGFAFNRFKIHFKYFVQRIKVNKQINNEISLKIKNEYSISNPEIYQCATEIISKIEDRFEYQITDDEIFYLMLYINRMIQQIRGKKDE